MHKYVLALAVLFILTSCGNDQATSRSVKIEETGSIPPLQNSNPDSSTIITHGPGSSDQTSPSSPDTQPETIPEAPAPSPTLVTTGEVQYTLPNVQMVQAKYGFGLYISKSFFNPSANMMVVDVTYLSQDTKSKTYKRSEILDCIAEAYTSPSKQYTRFYQIAAVDELNNRLSFTGPETTRRITYNLNKIWTVEPNYQIPYSLLISIKCNIVSKNDYGAAQEATYRKP